jgi:hypothetical protein
MKKDGHTARVALRMPPMLAVKIARAVAATGLTPSEVIRRWCERGSLEDLYDTPLIPCQWRAAGMS